MLVLSRSYSWWLVDMASVTEEHIPYCWCKRLLSQGKLSVTVGQVRKKTELKTELNHKNKHHGPWAVWSLACHSLGFYSRSLCVESYLWEWEELVCSSHIPFLQDFLSPLQRPSHQALSKPFGCAFRKLHTIRKIYVRVKLTLSGSS